ncbi:VOC family protein [Bacillus sp. JJ1562]|uniref:VOC family protein n=1 Tax=Bacillus sp. JJ1562 TaxID=3122960 RepID=UPI00300286F3
MIYEMTLQFRVSDFSRGQKWYETLLQKKPDYIPHDGFAEWELLPGCWLQIAEGNSSLGSGPLRLGVDNLEKERVRLIRDLKLEPFEIYSREEVPVKWTTFSDPWGNKVGLFEYHKESEKEERKKTIFGLQK